MAVKILRELGRSLARQLRVCGVCTTALGGCQGRRASYAVFRISALNTAMNNAARKVDTRINLLPSATVSTNPASSQVPVITAMFNMKLGCAGRKKAPTSGAFEKVGISFGCLFESC